MTTEVTIKDRKPLENELGLDVREVMELEAGASRFADVTQDLDDLLDLAARVKKLVDTDINRRISIVADQTRQAAAAVKAERAKTARLATAGARIAGEAEELRGLIERLGKEHRAYAIDMGKKHERDIQDLTEDFKAALEKAKAEVPTIRKGVYAGARVDQEMLDDLQSVSDKWMKRAHNAEQENRELRTRLENAEGKAEA